MPGTEIAAKNGQLIGNRASSTQPEAAVALVITLPWPKARRAVMRSCTWSSALPWGLVGAAGIEPATSPV